MIAYMILGLLAVIKNTVFQKDLFACITVPLRFWYRYIEWLIHPSELNILGEREYFSTEWSWFLRIMAILIFLGLGISGEIFVLRKIEQYRKAGDCNYACRKNSGQRKERGEESGAIRKVHKRI